MGVLPERKRRESGEKKEGTLHTIRTENATAKNGRGTDKRQGIWRERRRLHAGSQGKMGQM